MTTVHHSVEWISEAHERQLISPELTADFLQAAGVSRTVRNIREHFLEYLNGGGKQKKHNLQEATLSNGLVVRSDASSTIIDGDDRLIGGRIHVQALMREANALHPKLFEISIAMPQDTD